MSENPIGKLYKAERENNNGNGRPRILLAEDSEDHIVLVTTWLTSIGYEVLHVDNGEDAIEAARSGGIDLVILDNRMPGLTGEEALPRIRIENPDLPVFMYSADTRKEQAEKLLSEGLTAFFPKTDGLKTLVGAVQTLIPLQE